MKKLTFSRLIAFAAIVLMSAIPVRADFWGQLGKSLLNGLNTAAQMTEQQMVENYINSPSQHSADMKKFLSLIEQGSQQYAQGEYSVAWGRFVDAQKVAQNTTDRYLNLAYYKYGWKQQVESYTVSAWNASDVGGGSSSSYYNSGGSYSTGGSSSSSSSSSSSRKCSLCNGTGLKISEHYSAGQTKWCDICKKNKGTGHQHVRCDMCNGTGTLNY